VTEQLPGVPFEVQYITVYYVPRHGSRFAASISKVLTLKMHQWQSNFSVAFGRADGNGQAVPVVVSLSSPLARTPVGGIAITDVSNGGTCQARIDGAFPYGGPGRMTLLVDLPQGTNTLSFTYLGDAYFAPQQAADYSAPISTGGRSATTCPSDWARVAPRAWVAPVAGTDVPLAKFGFPKAYGMFDPEALANPEVGTLVVQLNWRDVEPSPGDFTKADAEVRVALSQGKRIALVLRFQSGLILSGSSSNCTWNYAHAQLLPRWVGDTLGATDSFCSAGTTLTVPKYWGAPFIALWTSYVDQVAAHFAPFASNIAYVRAPVGLGDEAKVITGPNAKPKKQDVQHLLQWGLQSPALGGVAGGHVAVLSTGVLVLPVGAVHNQSARHQ
jgi:hypothetical protein